MHACIHTYRQADRHTYIHIYENVGCYSMGIHWVYWGKDMIHIYIYAWYMIGMFFFILIQVCAYIFIYVGYLIGIFFENCNQHQPGHSLNGEMYDSLQCI